MFRCWLDIGTTVNQFLSVYGRFAYLLFADVLGRFANVL